MAEPDLELKGGEGALFVVCPAGFSSFCNFFYPKQGGGPGPPDPSLRGREGSLHGENLQIQKALREVEADLDNHQQVLMLTKKVERWEADLAEALTENKWLEAELENYTGNDRKNVEEVDIVKTQ